MIGRVEDEPLPRDWTAVSLKAIVAKLVDGSHNPPSKRESGVPMLSARNILNNQIAFEAHRLISEEDFKREHARTRISPGDVLLTIVGTIGRSAVVPASAKRFALQRSVAVITPTGVLPKYLMYQFQSPFLQRHFETNARGTAQKGVYLKTLGQTPILVAPLRQQELIVAEIEKQFSRLDEAVANLKRVKANLKRYKAAVLKAAVEGKLTPAEKPWKQVILGDIASSIRNGFSKKPDAEQGTRIFRISAVRPMELNANDVRYLSGVPGDYQSYLVELGDVLFTRYNGSRDYVGVCARIPSGLPPTVYPDKLIRVRVPSSMLLPEFLVILASTGRARQYVESKIRTTAGQSGISGGDLKSLPLDLPRVDEQRRIVAEVEHHLSVIEKLEATVEANLTRADRLRQSILSNVFAGKLVCANTSQSGERRADIQMAKSLE